MKGISFHRFHLFHQFRKDGGGGGNDVIRIVKYARTSWKSHKI